MILLSYKAWGTCAGPVAGQRPSLLISAGCWCLGEQWGPLGTPRKPSHFLSRCTALPFPPSNRLEAIASQSRDGGVPLAISLLLPNQDQMPPASTSNCPKIKTNHWQIRIKKKKRLSLALVSLRLRDTAGCQQGPRALGCALSRLGYSPVCVSVCVPHQRSVSGDPSALASELA